MNKEKEIKRLEELIEDENPALHRWIDRVQTEINKLKRQK